MDLASAHTLLLHLPGRGLVVLRDEGEDDVEALPEHEAGPLLLDAHVAVAELDLDVPGAVHILHRVLVPGRRLEQIISVQRNHEREMRHPGYCLSIHRLVNSINLHLKGRKIIITLHNIINEIPLPCL